MTAKGDKWAVAMLMIAAAFGALAIWTHSAIPLPFAGASFILAFMLYLGD